MERVNIFENIQIGEERKPFPCFVKHEHQCYDKFLQNDDFKLLLQELSQTQRMSHKQMDRIAKETKIKKETLTTWRKKLKKDKNYLPKHGPKCINTRIPEAAIKSIIKTVCADYIKQNRYLPPRAFRSIALKEASLHGAIDFKASRNWRNKFLAENNLSIRKPHIKRRSDPDDVIVSSFLSDLEVACIQYPPSLIFNTDETCWRVCNGIVRTITYKGSDEVLINSAIDAKEGITIMATINKAGEKLPLWVLATGKTERCKKRFQEDKRIRHLIAAKKICLEYSPNGWFTEDLRFGQILEMAI